MRIAKSRRSKELVSLREQNVLLDENQNPYDITFGDSLERVKLELKKIKTNSAIIIKK